MHRYFSYFKSPIGKTSNGCITRIQKPPQSFEMILNKNTSINKTEIQHLQDTQDMQHMQDTQNTQDLQDTQNLQDLQDLQDNEEKSNEEMTTLKPMYNIITVPSHIQYINHIKRFKNIETYMNTVNKYYYFSLTIKYWSSYHISVSPTINFGLIQKIEIDNTMNDSMILFFVNTNAIIRLTFTFPLKEILRIDIRCQNENDTIYSYLNEFIEKNKTNTASYFYQHQRPPLTLSNGNKQFTFVRYNIKADYSDNYYNPTFIDHRSNLEDYKKSYENQEEYLTIIPNFTKPMFNFINKDSTSCYKPPKLETSNNTINNADLYSESEANLSQSDKSNLSYKTDFSIESYDNLSNLSHLSNNTNLDGSPNIDKQSFDKQYFDSLLRI
jgi:hypothetical protein